MSGPRPSDSPARQAAVEGGRLARFCATHGAPYDEDGVVLYLASILDEGAMSGRALRRRVGLLDAHFAREGRVPPSRSPACRAFMRGLQQIAPLGPVTERTPLYLEDVVAILDAISTDRLAQVRARAFLLLANATGLPRTALREITWSQVRTRRNRLQLTVTTARYRYGPRGHFDVAAEAFPLCVAEIRALRHLSGPGPGYVFGTTPDRPGGRAWSSDITAALPARQRTWTWQAVQPLPESQLADALQALDQPSLRQLRNAALVTLSFAACLTGLEASRLTCGQVADGQAGLRVHLPHRRQDVAVPLARGRHCPVLSWRAWRAALETTGAGTADSPAFPAIHGEGVPGQALELLGLFRCVSELAANAGLSGEFGFTSLRLGFIRTALRAEVPETLILAQSGLVTMRGLELHARRERLVSHSIAGLVGL